MENYLRKVVIEGLFEKTIIILLILLKEPIVFMGITAQERLL